MDLFTHFQYIQRCWRQQGVERIIADTNSSFNITDLIRLIDVLECPRIMRFMDEYLISNPTINKDEVISSADIMFHFDTNNTFPVHSAVLVMNSKVLRHYVFDHRERDIRQGLAGNIQRHAIACC